MNIGIWKVTNEQRYLESYSEAKVSRKLYRVTKVSRKLQRNKGIQKIKEEQRYLENYRGTKVSRKLQRNKGIQNVTKEHVDLENMKGWLFQTANGLKLFPINQDKERYERTVPIIRFLQSWSFQAASQRRDSTLNMERNRHALH